MHEMSVTESMLGVVIRHAEKNRSRRIKQINMVLGETSSVMPESVQFYFDLLSKDTIAEGARLNFRRTELSARCSDCDREFKVLDYDFTCPGCKGQNTEITGGREFQVESIEVE